MTAENIKKCIFLDRDGVISPDDFGYISEPSSIILSLYYRGIKVFKELDFLLFVVTNQSGIEEVIFL
jgi:histidinol phosphatase-like enzyme